MHQMCHHVPDAPDAPDAPEQMGRVLKSRETLWGSQKSLGFLEFEVQVQMALHSKPQVPSTKSCSFLWVGVSTEVVDISKMSPRWRERRCDSL